jgi:hypothetical protein
LSYTNYYEILSGNLFDFFEWDILLLILSLFFSKYLIFN